MPPAKYTGLSEGDARVICNAGGRASDEAIRSLVISYKLLGAREWFVIHHTDCGILTFTDDVMRIREHPLVPGRIPIYGYIYDRKSGRLVGVSEATEAGKAGMAT